MLLYCIMELLYNAEFQLGDEKVLEMDSGNGYTIA